MSYAAIVVLVDGSNTSERIIGEFGCVQDAQNWVDEEDTDRHGSSSYEYRKYQKMEESK